MLNLKVFITLLFVSPLEDLKVHILYISQSLLIIHALTATSSVCERKFALVQGIEIGMQESHTS